MKIKWLFIVWALLLGSTGVLFYLLLPSSEYTFYVTESIVIVCLLFLVYFYRKTVKPLHTIGNAVDLLNEQDFSSRLVPVGQQDADRIVHLFNRLMEQLKNERLHVREQNHFLDLLIRVSPMGVILFDFNRRITGANAAALGFLGNMAENEVTGRMLAELSSPLAARLVGLPHGSVETIRLSDAMIYRCSHLSFVDRGYVHPFLLIESLTSEIVKAEKKTYEKVIRMIAHEVNNSVAAVTSTLDSLGEVVSPYDETGDLGHIIQVCSDRCYGMNHFIARLADIVRIPEPHLQTVRLNSRIDACRLLMEDTCRRRNISLQILSDGDDPEVRLDPILFEQVMVNVVKNAAESIGTDGDIVIRSGGNPAVVEIADNGSGITKDDEEKLFTPFFSTKPAGQGIGLMLVREILDRHGCRFSLETGEDGWTRFTIRFPQGWKA